jgi:hypothetical protein
MASQINSLQLNIPKLLLDGATVSAGLESSHFALPTRSTTLTWQTFFGTNPASCTFKLWGSLDGTTFAVIDSSTVIGGEIRTVNTNVKFAYVELDAVSGGADVSVLLVAKDL